jgi:hypothetical protein
VITGLAKAAAKQEETMPVTLPANPENAPAEATDTLNRVALVLFAALMLFPAVVQFLPLPLRQYLGSLFR